MRMVAEYPYSLDDLVFRSIQGFRHFFMLSIYETFLERRPDD